MPLTNLPISYCLPRIVINRFFESKGLVRQQLDSFNEFMSNTIQEIVEETPELIIRPQSQHNPGEEDDNFEEKEVRIQFNQVYVSKPFHTEADGVQDAMFPKEARLRNLT